MGSGSLNVLALFVCLHALTVSAKPPDWISSEILEMVQSDKARCMAEHGTTEDLIDQVNEGHLPEGRELSCYMYCLFEAFSLADEDGEVETEMLIGFLPENMQSAAEELVVHCAKIPGSDPCDKMYQMAKCVQQRRPDLWFMV